MTLITLLAFLSIYCLYANDTMQYAAHESPVVLESTPNQDIMKLTQWLTDNCFQVNATKTQAMILGKSLTNRFHVAMRLFSNRSQMTSKCGKNKKVAHEAQPSVSLMFLPHFDVLCDLLLNRCMATWNLFVLYNKELKYTEKKPFYFKFRHFDRHENSTLT